MGQASGIMDFFDYSSAAIGMTYANSLNTGGAITIDGMADAPVRGAMTWEMVEGVQGAIVISHSIVTDIPGFVYSSYYLDDSTPTPTDCTGDAFAYGASGIWVQQAIPNTDPWLTPFPCAVARKFEPTRRIYYEAPGFTVANAQERDSQARTPLQNSIAAWAGSPPSTVVTPSISPNGGTFAISIAVTLSVTTPGAEIRYTTDATDPTVTSTLYSAPFVLTADAEVRVRGFLTGLTPSAIGGGTFTIVPSTDTDLDGLPDAWEESFFGTGNLSQGAGADPDMDGLTNLEEFNQGTNPTVSDSDNDGLSDGDEVNVHGTNPTNSDSDADGMTDGVEVSFGFDPLNGDQDNNALLDGLDDWDNDTIINQLDSTPGSPLATPAVPADDDDGSCGDCGALGIEIPLLLVLLVAIRRRRSRRSA